MAKKTCYLGVYADDELAVTKIEHAGRQAALDSVAQIPNHKAFVACGPGDFAEMTGAEMMSYWAALNGPTFEGDFANNEKNRDALFTMVVNASKVTPASGHDQPAPGAQAENPAGATEEGQTMNDTTATETNDNKGKTGKKKVIKKKIAKKKVAKGKKAAAPTPRAAAPLHISLPTNLVPPAGTTTGCYIRSLIMTGKFDTAAIIEKVKKHYPDSTTKGSDVSWNRAKLKNGGAKVPDAPKAKKGDE